MTADDLARAYRVLDVLDEQLRAIFSEVSAWQEQPQGQELCRGMDAFELAQQWISECASTQFGDDDWEEAILPLEEEQWPAPPSFQMIAGALRGVSARRLDPTPLASTPS